MAQDASRWKWCSLTPAVCVVAQAVLAATILSNAAASKARGQDLVPAPPDFHPSTPQVGETVIPRLDDGSPAVMVDDPSRTLMLDIDGDELIFDKPAAARSNRVRELDDADRRASEHLQQARVHLQGRANALALAECERALACNPDSRDARRVRARVYQALNRYDDVLNDLAYIIAREPDNVDALLQRASCLLERVLTGNAESVADAKNAVSEVLELAPAEPAARAFRGVIAGMEGDAKGAIDELSFAIAHGARWNDAYIYRAAASMQMNAYNDALRDLGRAAGLYGSVPTPSTILWKRARCYVELGELDLAICDYTTLISRHPKHHRGYQHRADVYVKKGELSLALADHDQAVKLRPAEADTYFRLSLVRWRQRDTRGAVADIDQMAQLQPRSCAPPICAGVMTLLRRQDLDRALSSFDRAIACEPNFALPYALRAYVRGKKTAWLPATADVLLAIRRLALIKFKYGVETKRIGDEEEQLKVFIAWEYKCEENAPPAEREAMKLEREVIQFAMNSLLAAVFEPAD
jgi:tetratricopeptide (TPR) repeat protein